jgi:pyruvate dehydrogenase E1 component alpha subunit
MTGFAERLSTFERGLESRMRDFRCAVHLCLGQEGVPAVLAEKLRPADWLFSTHRSHGHYLAKGGSEAALVAEIEGREEGVNGGFSGSQSFCDPALRFHSTAIVGGLIGVAVGAAQAEQMAGSGNIVVCCIGDAATEQGIFWEALNYTALHRLPLAFVCENNGLSVHAPLALRHARPLKDRVLAFGVSYWEGLGELSRLLEFRHLLPAFVEVNVTRECKHVSAMEDLRE